MSQITLLTGERRRTWSDEQKLAILDEAFGLAKEPWSRSVPVEARVEVCHIARGERSLKRSRLSGTETFRRARR